MSVAPSDAPPQRDRSHLEDSRPIPWDRTCNAPGWPAALDALLALLESREARSRQRRAVDRRKLREVLGAVVLALYATYRAEEDRWLAYSRRNDDYGPTFRRYLHPDVSTLTATTVADFLGAAGLADHRRGSFSRNGFGGGSGFRSRIRARAKLAALLEDSGVSPASLGAADWTELLRLKAPAERWGGPKRLIPYSDTDTTLALRTELQAYNAFLDQFRIDIEPQAVAPSELPVQANDDPADMADQRSRRLYRVFNNERWDHGGRFYGGWWQRIPSAHRRRLLIDGEETVELDFAALHPRFCYHLEGIPLAPGIDPYHVEDISGPNVRSAIKVAFNQLVNVDGPRRLKAPDGVRAMLPKGTSYAKLIRQIEMQHAPISSWLRKGRGVELQYLDSQIASTVLGFMRFRDICCLPVHDSFIVPRSAEATLGHAMLMAHWATLKKQTGIGSWPIISGWTSDAVRERAQAEVGEPLALLKARIGGMNSISTTTAPSGAPLAITGNGKNGQGAAIVQPTASCSFSSAEPRRVS
ncbi:MAG: hypothetical protein U0S50_03480 [Sphingopyxis sp.]|uniref:hypothetical protein n=1 Tax=Sphingopyxis sp. TaxID=1908224 RepID=UPI002ABBA4D1|nr:hypothetical protein [Sphingopyxis sp.]MDZ3830865.1 hypothetical protein [Sphingopyxis sp.]